MISNKSFFHPYIGGGFNSKKLFVVGASFNCDKSDCPFYTECTSVKSKDSSKFRNLCPYTNGKPLSEEPSLELSSDCIPHRTFAETVITALDLKMSVDSFLDCIIFTNYIQFILPEEDKYSAGKTTVRDLHSFKQNVEEINPDMIIMWGSTISKDIKNESVDTEELALSRNYYFHIQIGERIFPVLNTAHPSDPYRWNTKENIDAIIKYLTPFFNTNEDE